jgi:hypothetical protein
VNGQFASLSIFNLSVTGQFLRVNGQSFFTVKIHLRGKIDHSPFTLKRPRQKILSEFSPPLQRSGIAVKDFTGCFLIKL